MARVDVRKYFALVSALNVGKKVNGYLYVHKTALEAESLDLYNLLELARANMPVTREWNIAKLGLSTAKVSFLHYPEFFTQEHPALKSSVMTDLSNRTTRICNYANWKNPPILHRKETLLSATDPNYERFARLTREEEAYGLYESPGRIGHSKPWVELLRRKKLRLSDHRVSRLDSASQLKGDRT